MGGGFGTLAGGFGALAGGFCRGDGTLEGGFRGDGALGGGFRGDGGLGFRLDELGFRFGGEKDEELRELLELLLLLPLPLELEPLPFELEPLPFLRLPPFPLPFNTRFGV